MAIVLTIAELEAAHQTLEKLQEVAGDDTARAILMQAQLLMLTLSVRLILALEDGREEEANVQIRAN